MPIGKLLSGSYVETDYCGVSDGFLIVICRQTLIDFILRLTRKQA